MSDWQPIRTAPKDGSPEILGWPHQCRYNKHLPAPMAWDSRNERWMMVAAEGEVMGVSDYYNKKNPFSGPTHWMPLPEAPSIQPLIG